MQMNETMTIEHEMEVNKQEKQDKVNDEAETSQGSMQVYPNLDESEDDHEEDEGTRIWIWYGILSQLWGCWTRRFMSVMTAKTWLYQRAA